MTSLYSNKELLYSMPALGVATTAPGAASVVLTGNTTTNPAFKMPSIRQMWGLDKAIGRVFHVRMSGNFGTPAATPGTWLVACGLNTTQATKPTTIVLAATGAFTPASPNLSLGATAGKWRLVFDITVQSVGTNAGAAPNANVFTDGDFSFGPGNNAATAAGIDLMVGSGAVIAIDPTVEYWIEGYATFSTGPASTAIQCSQFLVSAEN